MTFQVNERVVYPAFGVGRVVGVVSKTFAEPEGRLYYEVLGERSTVWVAVEDSDARGLRRLTRREDLGQLRGVLRGQPAVLNADSRQRQLEVRARLRDGSMQSMAEVVRDLSGRGWHKPLNDSDLAALRRSSTALCEEWAAVMGVSPSQATTEVNGLLGEGRQSFKV
jgi:RNA polymerase-interacting CarD/CdnL/TRCF family regulator